MKYTPKQLDKIRQKIFKPGKIFVNITIKDGFFIVESKINVL